MTPQASSVALIAALRDGRRKTFDRLVVDVDGVAFGIRRQDKAAHSSLIETPVGCKYSITPRTRTHG
jgi:hypothetical protein